MKFISAVILLICWFVCVANSQQVSVNNEKGIYIFVDGIKLTKLAFREGVNLTEVIAETNNILPKKRRSIIFVYRLIPETKNREVIKVDLKAIQKKKINDFILQPDDVVILNSRKKPKFRGELFFAIS